MEGHGLWGKRVALGFHGLALTPYSLIPVVAAACGASQPSLSPEAVSQPGGLPCQPAPAPWASALLPHLCP